MLLRFARRLDIVLLSRTMPPRGLVCHSAGSLLHYAGGALLLSVAYWTTYQTTPYRGVSLCVIARCAVSTRTALYVPRRIALTLPRGLGTVRVLTRQAGTHRRTDWTIRTLRLLPRHIVCDVAAANGASFARVLPTTMRASACIFARPTSCMLRFLCATVYNWVRARTLVYLFISLATRLLYCYAIAAHATSLTAAGSATYSLTHTPRRCVSWWHTAARFVLVAIGGTATLRWT